MPVPKKRVSKSKKNMRRAHDFLSRTYAVICPKCQEMMLPHRVCGSCGSYRGKQIIKNEAAESAPATTPPAA